MTGCHGGISRKVGIEQSGEVRNNSYCEVGIHTSAQNLQILCLFLQHMPQLNIQNESAILLAAEGNIMGMLSHLWPLVTESPGQSSTAQAGHEESPHSSRSS